MKLSSAIADEGLQLGTLDALLRAGLLSTDRLRPALVVAKAAIEGEPTFWNGDELDLDGNRDHAMIARAVEALGDTDVTTSELASVTSLSFSGGNDIYMWLEPELALALGLEDYALDTGGESDSYLVESLEGLAALPALEQLSLEAYGYASHTRALTPLRGHPSLKRIVLAGRFSDQEALLECPALAHVQFAAHEALDPAVVQALRAKGIEVEER